MPIRLALPSLALLMLASAPVAAASIEVAVTNVREAKGFVRVSICPQASFLKDACPWFASAPAVVGTTIVTVPDVPPGRYAAQAFQDLNSNDKVDRALFGIPTEPVGFSNDAPIRLHPPRWADAAFDHGAERQRITLKLRSFF